MLKKSFAIRPLCDPTESSQGVLDLELIAPSARAGLHVRPDLSAFRRFAKSSNDCTAALCPTLPSARQSWGLARFFPWRFAPLRKEL